MLAVSQSFRALLSASSDGQVLLWDLNRLELVRRLTTGAPIEVSTSYDKQVKTRVTVNMATVCAYQ